MHRVYRLTLVMLAGFGLTLGEFNITRAEEESDESLTRARCVFTADDTSSGIGLTPVQGGFGSATGTIFCTGRIDGERLSPRPGFIEYSYTFGGDRLSEPLGGATCALGSGPGTVSVELPTIDNDTISLAGPLTYDYVGPAAEVRGTIGDHPFRMFVVFVEYPGDVSGNCVTQPVTHTLDNGMIMITD